MTLYCVCFFFSSGFGGNGATMFFLTFSILAAVLGIVSKFMGANHLRFWRSDSLASAGATSVIAWAVTALAMGYVKLLIIHYYETDTNTRDGHVSIMKHKHEHQTRTRSNTNTNYYIIVMHYE